MKYHAYVGPTGSVRKSAYQVKAERIKYYRGGPSKEKFFSLHREGARKPLEHVIGPGRPHFRYKDARDEGGLGGAGESIEHELFKEAVASLSRTRLSIEGRDYRMTIEHGETEKLIPGASRPYRSDAYLRFALEDGPDDLALKWSGEVYIEIHRTNLVEPGKHDEVRRLGIPMIEVTPPESLLYRHGGANTTDEKEQWYIRWLKSVLEGERGFLKGIVLNNPSSAPYLSQKLDETRAALRRAQQELSTVTLALEANQEAAAALEATMDGSNRRIDDLQAALSEAQKKEALQAKKISELNEQLAAERSLSSVLSKEVWTARLVFGGAVIVGLLLYAWLKH